MRDFHPLLHELSNYIKNADKVGIDAARHKMYKPRENYRHYVMKDIDPKDEEVQIKVSPRTARLCFALPCGSAKKVDVDDDDD